MKLYSYFRSSAAYRVRIALNLKGLPYEYASVHLLRGGGEQLSAEYRRICPDAIVPSLVDDDAVLRQSLAIIEYLEEVHPNPPLLPSTPVDRAHVRAIALQVACEIHPLNNLRVLKYLVRELKLGDDAKNTWYRHWVREGMLAFERQLAQHPASTYCWGNTPTMADCCLVPQIFNGRRFDCDFSGLPRTMAAFEACMELDAFQRAQPSQAPDAEA